MARLWRLPNRFIPSDAAEAALDLFGASLLTEREGEIIRLYLKGHSTRSIAERVGIPPHTVSMHPKNAYGKLDACSQFGLFHLFMDPIGCFAATASEDPLAQYLAPARPNRYAPVFRRRIRAKDHV